MSEVTGDEELRPIVRKVSTVQTRLGRRLIGAGIALVALWLIVTVVRIGRPAIDLATAARDGRAMMAAGWRQADPAEVERLIRDVRGDVLDLERAARPLAGAGERLGWLPKVGPLLADGDALLDMALSATEAAELGLPALRPSLEVLQSGQGGLMDSLPQLLANLDAAEEDLGRAAAALDRLEISRRSLAHEARWPESARQLLVRLDGDLRLARDGARLAAALPELAGHEAPRTYLLLAQNEDELRAAGGFISGAGRLTLDGGRIISLDFMDANLVDDWQNKPYDLPPMPYQEFMGMDIFLFRDANFWPDFPASAEQALQLYTYGRDLSADGVIAFDQRFLEMLLAAVGPVYVPEFEATVDSDSVVDLIRQQWGVREEGVNWVLERKSFMGPLAAALIQRFEGDGADLDLLHVARLLQAAAEQRHLQIYARGAPAQSRLEATSWAGRQVNARGQDFLLVVDTNLGFNKVNSAIGRSVELTVELAEDGRATSDLTVRYRNEAPYSGDCTHGYDYDSETQYQDLLVDCYWNYLRVYVPLGARLLGGSMHPVPSAMLMSDREWAGQSRQWDDEQLDLTVFDNFLVLAGSESVDFNVRYALPPISAVGADFEEYLLRVNKQAGLEAQPIHVTVIVPQGKEIVYAWPAGGTITENTIRFELPGQADEEIVVRYQ